MHGKKVSVSSEVRCGKDEPFLAALRCVRGFQSKLSILDCIFIGSARNECLRFTRYVDGVTLAYAKMRIARIVLAEDIPASSMAERWTKYANADCGWLVRKEPNFSREIRVSGETQ